MIKHRDDTIDIIKGIAIIAVLVIHTTAYFLKIGDKTSVFYFALVIDVVAQAAVPVLFFISGYLVALTKSANKNLTVFYKKKILRILPLYLIAATSYYFFVRDIDHSITGYIKAITLGSGAYYHLCFIPILIIVYILAPLILRLSEETTHRKLLNISIFMLPLFAALSPIFDTKSFTHFLPVCVVMFLLGVLAKSDLNLPSTARLLILYLMFQTIIIFIWSKYGLSRVEFASRPDTVRSFEFALHSLSGLIACVLLLRHRELIKNKLKFIAKPIAVFGIFSLEIYLVHIFFLGIIVSFMGDHSIYYNSIPFYIIAFIFTLITSFCFALIIKNLKWPRLKRIFNYN
jgi:peptidoglycan/LPS O-acetylase OafA/YrhL